MKLTNLTQSGKRVDSKSVQRSFARHLKYSLAKDRYTATEWDRYLALSLTIRDLLIERWIETQQRYHHLNIKRVYYLSLEYLLGRSLTNNIMNLEIKSTCNEALKQFEIDWEELYRLGVDAGLGNGGLGRLAACFLDSLATLALPATGYGLHYDYGIFRQVIQDGYQVEEPDEWLRFGNPWEIERPEFTFSVHFGGHVENRQFQGKEIFDWRPTHHVIGIPFDMPIVGYGNDTVNTLRLWSAKASEDFDFDDFNQGDYIEAVKHKILAENLTKVLYPNDNNLSGKELRFQQQYFFVSCSIQDIVRRYKQHNHGFDDFPDKVAIQLNDTHPAIAVAELMHILIDKEDVPWEIAWNVTVKTFAYTNHTLLPEALEKWPVSFFEKYLPRHLQIIYEINSRFLDKVSLQYPGDLDRLRRMSIVDEDAGKQIRMANLATVGSHSVNGVAELHTELLKKHLFRDFHEFYPQKFNNKTNGITPRRWLLNANPNLAQWISSKIGKGWIVGLEQLTELSSLADDATLVEEINRIKFDNKQSLAKLIVEETGVEVDPAAIFDVHIKRFHEYKRQLLNILHVITLYNRLKHDPDVDLVPRVFIFSGKAAPGYYMAKLIIKLINSVAEVINNDTDIKGRIKIIFFPNYSVSLAESIIPAADVSEQISTAGMEASGTGNMKLMLNGALTIGTLDGANIEIKNEVGDDNIFIFGLTASEVEDLRRPGAYDSLHHCESDAELQSTLDLISSNFFSLHSPDLFVPIVDAIRKHGDYYFVAADFRSYAEAHKQIDNLYREPLAWGRKSLMNIAKAGKFSSDRTIREYAQDIWHANPVTIDLLSRGTDTIVEARAKLGFKE